MNRKLSGIFAVCIVALLIVGFVSAHGMGGFESDEDRDALREAIESGDYETWKELKMAQLTEENFDKLYKEYQNRAEFEAAVEELKESEDFSMESLRELQEEYGIDFPGPKMGMEERPKMDRKPCDDCPLAE